MVGPRSDVFINHSIEGIDFYILKYIKIFNDFEKNVVFGFYIPKYIKIGTPFLSAFSPEGNIVRGTSSVLKFIFSSPCLTTD